MRDWQSEDGVAIVSGGDDAAPTTVHLQGYDEHGNWVEEDLTVGQETVTSKHSYHSMGASPAFDDCGYESHEEAWESGYSAALHDVECYLLQSRPRWAPRWLWRKVAGALERAYRDRGSDL